MHPQVQSVGRTKGDLLRVLSYVTKDGEHNQEMNDVALFKKAADQALRARHRTRSAKVSDSLITVTLHHQFTGAQHLRNSPEAVQRP